MSTITTYPEVASQTGKARTEQKNAELAGFRFDGPGHTDEDMMFAWSIGVTTTAREMVPRGAESHEECPPEVYIG